MLSHRFLASKAINLSLSRLFATTTSNTDSPQLQETSHCVSFYRKSIRKVNIKQKTGRGTFNEHALIRMMKISRPADMEVLCEAFYNYMGHFTIYSNRTVDSFVHKILHLSKLEPNQTQLAGQKIFEIFKHHDYLRYYPSYKSTLNTAKFCHQLGKFTEFLDLLNEKPLIKLNKQIYEELIAMDTTWSDFSRIVKLGAYRMNWGILDGMTKNQLLLLIINKLDKFDEMPSLNSSRPYTQFLRSFDSSEASPELLIGWLINSNGLSRSLKILKSLPKETPNLGKYIEVARKLDEASNFEYLQNIRKSLQNTHHAILLQ